MCTDRSAGPVEFFRVPVDISPRYSVDRDGNIYGPRGKLKGSLDTYGYHQVAVTISGRARKQKTVKTHTLVCIAFNGRRPGGSDQVRHRDGNKLNNRPENLTWGNAKENAEDRDMHGTTVRGERHHNSKLTSSDVIDIRRRLADGESGSSIARDLGINKTTVSRVKLGRWWRHVA